MRSQLVATVYAHANGVKVKLIYQDARYAVCYMSDEGWLHLRDVLRLGCTQAGRALVIQDHRPNSEERLYGELR